MRDRHASPSLTATPSARRNDREETQRHNERLAYLATFLHQSAYIVGEVLYGEVVGFLR